MIITHTTTEPLILSRVGMIVPMSDVWDGEVFHWVYKNNGIVSSSLWMRVEDSIYHDCNRRWQYNTTGFFNGNNNHVVDAFIIEDPGYPIEHGPR
jgi:hypothetical protein